MPGEGGKYREGAARCAGKPVDNVGDNGTRLLGIPTPFLLRGELRVPLLPYRLRTGFAYPHSAQRLGRPNLRSRTRKTLTRGPFPSAGAHASTLSHGGACQPSSRLPRLVRAHRHGHRPRRGGTLCTKPLSRRKSGALPAGRVSDHSHDTATRNPPP
jgi:hypothetical protein